MLTIKLLMMTNVSEGSFKWRVNVNNLNLLSLFFLILIEF